MLFAILNYFLKLKKKLSQNKDLKCSIVLEKLKLIKFSFKDDGCPSFIPITSNAKNSSQLKMFVSK